VGRSQSDGNCALRRWTSCHRQFGTLLATLKARNYRLDDGQFFAAFAIADHFRTWRERALPLARSGLGGSTTGLSSVASSKLNLSRNFYHESALEKTREKMTEGKICIPFM
jgi:hypothetical protein